MGQKEYNLYRLFKFPTFYDFFQKIVGLNLMRKHLVQNYLKPVSNIKILDVGCGTGQILNFLPKDVDYCGYDLDENYINLAKKKFSSNKKCRFYCYDVSNIKIEENNKFDVVLLIGLLHHIEDEEAKLFLNESLNWLNENGFVLSLDPLLCENQSFLSKFFVTRDRGNNVRTGEEYLKLFEGFKNVSLKRETNLRRIPYDDCFIVAKNYSYDKF